MPLLLKIRSWFSNVQSRPLIKLKGDKTNDRDPKIISHPIKMNLAVPTPAIVDLLDPAFRNTIVLFGDSITEWSFGDDDEGTKGFGYQLERYYMGKAQVLNRGVAGSVKEISYCLKILLENTNSDDLASQIYF